MGMAGASLAGCVDRLVASDEPEPSGTPVVGGRNDDFEFLHHEPELANDYEAYADNAVSGGVPQDGIPSIDDPVFEAAAYGDANMDPGDPVFGLTLEGEARAYPQYILVRHEIVNDDIGGYGVAVTYCPLTGTAIGFERGEDEFGVSGMLVNSNLIMYDHSSESWWPQVLGTLVKGDDDEEVEGTKLGEVRVTWTTWERWRDTYPQTRVLSEDTGDAFSYTRDPYGGYNPKSGYYSSSDLMFGVMHEDDRHHPKEVVIGARSRDGAVAFTKERLRDQHLLETTVGAVPYLAAYHEGLDAAWVYRNPEDKSFTVTDLGYEGPDGTVYEADALPLEEINAFDAMWFAWVAFYPNTVVVD